MQDENATGGEMSNDLLSGWKSGSSFVLAVAITWIIGKASGNMLYSSLLFFPVYRVFSGLFNNNMLKLYSGVLCIAAYPLIKIICAAICGIILSSINTKIAGSSCNLGVD